MSVKPTNNEYEILNLIWDRGPSTVREIHDALAVQKKTVYTTTLKTMQVMLEKGFLKRNAKQKVHVYKAAIKQTSTERDLVNRIIENVFRGSASKLIMRVLGDAEVSQEEINKIQKHLNKLKKNDD